MRKVNDYKCCGIRIMDPRLQEESLRADQATRVDSKAIRAAIAPGVDTETSGAPSCPGSARQKPPREVLTTVKARGRALSTTGASRSSERTRARGWFPAE